jgi:glycosyltransferase involved in cell wall biosynthesis
MTEAALRLLLVTDSYPPLIGGADLQAQMIARAMRDRGHRVAVVTPWQVGLETDEDDDGLEVHRIRPLATRLPWISGDPGRRHHPPFPDPAVAIAIRRIIRTLHPDLVHSYGWISYSAAAAMLGTSIPLVLSARDYGYVCGVRNYLFHDGYVCSGPALAKCLRCATDTYVHEAAGTSLAGAAKALAAPPSDVPAASWTYVSVAQRRHFAKAGPLHT